MLHADVGSLSALPGEDRGHGWPAGRSAAPPARAQGLPKVAMRSTRHSNSTRLSSMAGSRSP